MKENNNNKQQQQTFSITQTCKKQAQQRIWSIDWHPNGHLLASVGSSKKIKLWKFVEQNSTIQLMQTIQTQHSKTIRNVKFSHDGNKIAVASFDTEISVWVRPPQDQLDQEQFPGESYQLLSMLQGHQNQVKCVSWSPSDKKLASCSRDKNVWVWQFDQISYEYICESVLEGHTQDVKYIQWINQSKLVSCSYDNTLRVWEMQDDDYVCIAVLQRHSSIVWAVKSLYQGKQLISVSEDCSAIHWKAENWQEQNASNKYTVCRKYENYHVFPIYSCDVSTNNQYLLTGSGDNAIKMVQLNQPQNKESKGYGQVTVSHQADVNCVKFHSKNTQIRIFASCSDDQSIRIWKY